MSSSNEEAARLRGEAERIALQTNTPKPQYETGYDSATQQTYEKAVKGK